MEIDISNIPKKYDYVFSFSFLQYIPAKDIGYLQSRIQDLLCDNAVIVHFSIPDKRFWLVTTVVTQIKRRGNVGLLIAPLLHILYVLYHKNRYGIGGFWHDPIAIEKALAASWQIKILPSDVYYRFDIVQKITR